MRLGIVWMVLVLTVAGCSKDGRKLYDEFQPVNVNGWSWTDAKSFTFTIPDSSYLYEVHCGLRITGSYNYSNIYLLYSLEGNGVAARNLFQMTLSDNTGKWLGKGSSNLISYDHLMLANAKLKPGKYTIRVAQNMRDEMLKNVSDIGIYVTKGNKIY